jgi:magnesium transporter
MLTHRPPAPVISGSNFRLDENNMPGSKYYHISPAGNIAGMPTLEESLLRVKSGGFLWLDYCQPTKEDLVPLRDALGLHPLAIEDCTDANQIPKIDDYPGNTFMLFNAFRCAGKKYFLDEVDVFIGENFLITVKGVDTEKRPLLEDLERIVKLDLESVRQGPAFLLHVILDHIVDQKFLVIEALEEEIDKSEEALLADLSSFKPADLFRLRRKLLTLRKSLFHEREILVRICRKDCAYIGEKAVFFYRDIYDHLTKFFELIESSRDVVTSLLEMYLSMLNNRMAQTANETNQTVRRLTLITTIFMPLTLLAGVGGMSEWSMITGPANWRISYPAFLFAMAGIGLVNYYLITWFEKRNRASQFPAGRQKRPH